MFISNAKATWLVVMIIPMLSDWMKSTVTFDFVNLRSLLILKICLLAHEMTIFELSWLIGIITYFLEGPLVVILSLGQALWLIPWAILWISIIFFGTNLRKASLTFRMSSTLPFVAWANNFEPSLDLASLDLARMIVLSLGGIGGGILEIFAKWDMLPAFESFGFPLLNYDTMHWWKVLELLSAMSLSYPELYIAKIRF